MADHNFACQVSAPAAESVSTSQAHPSMPTQITNSNTTYNHCSNISHGTVHYHVSPTETNGGPSTINNGVNEDENEGDDAEEDDKVVPQFDLATNMLLIPFELIPKDEKDINAHADRYFNFWRHLDSRQIRDRVVHAKTQDALKDFAKKIRSIHKQASYIGASEYARVACEDLNQEVEGLIHDGKIKAIERLVQLPHFFASVRKHSPRDKPMVGLDISYRVLHHLNWEDSRFNREELPQKINEWGKEHDPPFQLLQVQPKVKNGRKRRMTNHPLVQIANEKARHNKKLIQRAETSAFGMSIRVRQPSKPPEGHTIIEYTPNVFLAVKNQVFPSIGASSTLNDLIKVMQSQKQLTGPLPQEKQEQPSWQEQPSFTEIIQKLAMQNDRNALIRAIDRAYMNMGRQSQDEIGPMIQTPNRHVEDSSSARQSQYEIGPMVQTPNRNVEDSSSSPAVSSYGGISLPDGFEDVVDDCVNTISRDDDEDKQASTGAPDFYSALNRHGIPIGVPIRHDDEEEVSKESDMDDFNNAFLCDKTEKNERDSKKERDSVSKEKSRQAFASDIKDARDCGHKTSGSAWDVVDIYSRRKKKRNVEVFIEYAESFNGEWKKERFSWQPVSNLSAADREKFESEYIPLKNKVLNDFYYAISVPHLLTMLVMLYSELHRRQG